MKLDLSIISTCFITGLLLSINTMAQKPDALKLKTLPFPLKVVNTPLDAEVTSDSILTITSPENTNLFNSPGDNFYVQNAPMVVFHPDSNFVMSAKIKADLKEVYDVAALVIYQHKDLWAKLCFENSINKQATVVSVVTRKYSDDCNSIKLTNDFVYLAIAKSGNEFSFHCSTDHIHWDMVRHFKLDCDKSSLMIGFTAHCSRGMKFSAEFSDIHYTNNGLKDMRKYE